MTQQMQLGSNRSACRCRGNHDMSHSIQLSPELYGILQQQAVVLNATIESLIEAAVRRDYGQASPPKPNRAGKGHNANGVSNAANSTTLAKNLDELDQVAFLTDAELWQAARTHLNSADRNRMEGLLQKQQAIGLQPDELTEAEMLADRYDRTLLVRAKAAVLLKERGHDVASLGPDPV